MAEINKPAGLNKLWAINGVSISPTDQKINAGWEVEAPPHQWENWLNNKHDTALAHINQHGWFEWDNLTEYRANKSWTLGSDGSVYYCKITNTNINPVTDVSETNWRKVLNGDSLVTSPQVTTYMKTWLLQPDAPSARYYLGMSTVGQNISSSATQIDARNALGMTNTGQSIATAPSTASVKAILGIGSANDVFEGLVQRATDTEAIVATNDTKFITPKKLKLGFSLSLNINGWLDLPSWLGGAQFRWGRFYSDKNSSTTVLFAKPFSSACLNLITSFYEDIPRGDVSLSSSDAGIASFLSHYHRDGSGGGPVYCSYFTFGY